MYVYIQSLQAPLTFSTGFGWARDNRHSYDVMVRLRLYARTDCKYDWPAESCSVPFRADVKLPRRARCSLLSSNLHADSAA